MSYRNRPNRRGLAATLLLPAVLLVSACAGGPRFIADNGINTELIATEAARQDALGERVVWGGRIVETRVLEDDSMVEVLAYPLDRSERPRTERSTQGRFLVRHAGFLEPQDYRSGRLITVRGEITEIIDGRVGEADYRFPLVEEEGIHLWPVQPPGVRPEPRVRFGVGVHIMR